MSGDEEKLIKELLAIIHSDGGHNLSKNGYEKSINEAIKICLKMKSA